MGRRENAVAADTKQAKALALWLRAQRERQGLTYAAMATLTGHQFTASALSRGASGRVPSLRLVLAFATACDADLDEAVRLWKAARKAKEERRRQAGISPEFRDLASSVRSVLTHPDLVDTFGKLHDVMVEMRARQGQPSLGEMQTLAGRTPNGRHRLPKSSLSIILRGEAVPSRRHLTAFMESMGHSPDTVRRWQQVWDRISEAERPSPAAARPQFLVDAPWPDSPTWHETAAYPMLAQEDYFDLLRGQITLKVPYSPSRQQGPRPARPFAGTTHAGLPIRTPRRYRVLLGAANSPTMGVIMLQSRDAPAPLPSDAGSSPPIILPTQAAASGIRPTRPARPATLGSLGRAIKRSLLKRARSDHTRWPNF
ncbi:helix-turn-helix domain-containing protein [Streptomyces sp. NPDC058294]|uniref:helix-turn-helix domain-containing protein n=1 Tax=Streptomyces sp. NPDC058294 TaxID=3346430 RepID=UPI0036E6449D